MDDVSDADVRAGIYDANGGWFLDGLGGLGTATDDAGYFGYLPYHSFHQIKANAFYKLPWGTNFGIVYEFDSGHAWQKRALVPLYGDYYAFQEGRGSRFMPSVHYVDVRLAQAFKLDELRTLEVTLDVFNLPDTSTPITYYENDNDSFGLTLNRQEPRAIRAGMKLTY